MTGVARPIDLKAWSQSRFIARAEDPRRREAADPSGPIRLPELGIKVPPDNVDSGVEFG